MKSLPICFPRVPSDALSKLHEVISWTNQFTRHNHTSHSPSYSSCSRSSHVRLIRILLPLAQSRKDFPLDCHPKKKFPLPIRIQCFQLINFNFLSGPCCKRPGFPWGSPTSAVWSRLGPTQTSVALVFRLLSLSPVFNPSVLS